MKGFCVLLLFAAMVPATALPVSPLVNGDFRLPLDSGWQRSVRDIVGSSFVGLDRDGGVRVRKTMCGHARLEQEVALTGLDFDFSARAKFKAETNNPSYHAYAALVLSYLDKSGQRLGETRWYRLSGAKPWQAGPKVHLIAVAGDTFSDLRINLKEELRQNLKSIVPGQVARVRVTLESFGSGSSAC